MNVGAVPQVRTTWHSVGLDDARVIARQEILPPPVC